MSYEETRKQLYSEIGVKAPERAQEKTSGGTSTQKKSGETVYQKALKDAQLAHERYKKPIIPKNKLPFPALEPMIQPVAVHNQDGFKRMEPGVLPRETGYRAEQASRGYEYITKMKEQAQAEYDAYVAERSKPENVGKNMRAAMLDAYRNGTSLDETAWMQPTTEEQQLKAVLDFWKNQETQYQIEKVSEKNLREFLRWPKEDRDMMELYNANRAGRLAWLSASADQSNTQEAYENASRLGAARAAEMALVSKYGEEKVQKIAETLSWVKNRNTTERFREKAQNVPDNAGAGIAATLAGRAANLVGSVTGTAGQLQNLIIKPTGQYPTLDPNNIGNLPNVVADEMTNAVAENIRGEDPTAMREASAMLYRTGVSAADSLIRAYAGGVKPISRALIASSSFGSAMAEYSAHGASPVEAVLMSTVDAGLEVLTEELPLDRILKQAEIAPASFTDWLKETAKSAAIEMGEEGTNFVGSAIAQGVLLKGNSEYNQNIAQMMMRGMSYEDAKAAADKNVVMQGAATLIESALSGGMMGGASQAVGAGKAKRLGKSLDKIDPGHWSQDMMIRKGLEQPEGSTENTVARQMQDKIDGGKSLSQYDLGRLYQATAGLQSNYQQNGVPKAEQNTQNAEQSGEIQEQNTQNTEQNAVVPEQNAVNTEQNAVRPEQERTVVAKDEVPMESLPPVERESLKRLSEATGRKVHAYTKPAGEHTLENGYFKDGEIWVNTETKQYHVQVFSHELTHSIEQSKYYGDIRTIAMRELGKKLDLDNFRKDTKWKYEMDGGKISWEDVDREIVADYVAEYLLTDEQAILDLTRENRSIAKKILNWIDNVLAQIGNEKAQERVFLRNARQIYAMALNETRGQAGQKNQTREQTQGKTQSQQEQAFDWTQAPTDPESYRDWVDAKYAAGEMDDDEYEGMQEYFRQQEDSGELKKRFSYAGQGARTADLQGLETARQMEKQEVAQETIRQETGWYRGMDGKWRFEIDDSKSRVRGANQRYMKLGEILEHDELFESYPDMKNMRVEFADLPEGTKAEYSRELDSIRISRGIMDSSEEIRNAVLHEIQHGIQNREGFTRGASTEYWEKRQKDRDSSIREYDKKIEQEVNHANQILDGVPDNVADSFRGWYDLYSRDEDEGMRRAAELTNGEYGKQFDDYLMTVWNIENLRKFNNLRGANDLYQNTAGEIEARDVQSRKDLDDEGRKKTPPNLGDERTVFSDYEDRMMELDEKYGDRVREYHEVRISEKEIDDAMETVTRMKPVTQISGSEFEKGKVDLITQVGQFFDGMNNEAYNDTLGTVILDKKGIKSDIAHGIGRKKAASFAAIQEVIQEGKVVDYRKNWKGRGYDTAVIAAPIMIGEDEYIAGVVVERSNKTNNFYVHEVYAEKNGAMPFKTGTQKKGTPSGDAPSVISILRRIWDVKEGRKNNAQFSLSLVGKAAGQSGEQREKTPRERLDQKGQAFLSSVERKMVNAIGKKLNVPWVAKREELLPIMQKITDAYLETGRIDDVLQSQLFEEALEKGLVIDDEYYNQYKEVKDWIGTVGITISKQDQADIPDYAEFKKRARGTVKIVKDGMPVDSAYQELRTMWPELFPEKITHPADQLQRIYDVAHGIQISKQTVDEFYGPDAERYKQYYRNDFETVMMEEILPDLKRVKQSADQQAAKEKRESVFPKTVPEAMETFQSMMKARTEYEKAKAGKYLSPDEEIIVKKLLCGEMKLEELDEEKYKDYSKQSILSIFQAKQPYEELAKQLTRYKSHIKGQMLEAADRILGDSIDWKDKKSGGAYARETMPRNVLDIVPDRERAKEINRTYFEPVQIHEAESTRFKNEMRDRVRAMNISTEVKKGDVISESAAVQIIGEAMDHMEQLARQNGRQKYQNGLTMEQWQSVINDVVEKNPSLDPKKIKQNVEQFRKIYDELLQKMNEIRVQYGYEPVKYRTGYFPHFIAEEGDNLLTRMGLGLGVDTRIDALPTSINGLTSTFKPGIQWFGHALERKGENTTYDAVLGFDKYIEGVANVIYHTGDIQNLRALESQIRYRTTDEGIRKQVDEVRNDPRLTDEEKESKIREIYERGRFTLSNFCNELMEYTNLLAGKKSRLDRGVESLMGRKIYSVMKKLEGRVGANMIAGNLSSALTNFIPLQQAWTRMDRGTLARGMWDTLKNGKELMFRNPGDGFASMSDFLTNRRGSQPLVMTGMEQFSNILGKPMEWIDGFVSESIVRGAYRQNLRRGLSGSEAMHQADLFAAGVMADRSKGAMPTLFESRNPLIKAFTQFQLEVNNQFSEVLKDIPREVGEEDKAALVLAMTKYFLFAYLFNDVYEYLTGRRPALDPLGILNDTVGDFTGYELPNLLEAGEDLIHGKKPDLTTEKKKGDKAAKNLVENVAGQMPFSSVLYGGRIPVSAAMPDLDQLFKLGNEDIAPEKKRDILLNQALKLGYVVSPFGYGQGQKTWKGVKAAIEGGSYSINDKGEKELQYPIFQEDRIGAGVKGFFLGKSSLPQAQEWAETGYKSLSGEQTALYQDLIATGTKDSTAYEVIQKVEEVMRAPAMEEKSRNQNMLEVLLGMDLTPKARAMTYERSIDKSKTKTFMEENRDNQEVYNLAPEVAQAQKGEDESTTAAKLRVIQNADISEDAKSVLYYGMVADDDTRKLMDDMTDDGASGAEVAKVLMGIQQAEGLKGAEKSTAKRNAIADSNLEEEHKLQLYREKVADDKEDEISQFRAAGMDLDTFIEVQNEYARINETKNKQSQKAQDFSYWLEKQDFTYWQKKIAKDCFTYYSMVPADAKYFNQAVEAGVDTDKAYEAVNKISALKPKTGRNSVSDAQKLRVIVDSGLSERDQLKMVQSTSISETMKTRLPILVESGVSIKKQLQFWEKIFDFDADGSGKLDQREVRACLDSFPGGNDNPLEALLGIRSSSGPAWTSAEKAAMWQSYNTQWSAKKNPYNRTVGEEVKAAIKAAGK